MIKLINKKSNVDFVNLDKAKEEITTLEELVKDQKASGLGNPKLALNRYKEAVAVPRLLNEFQMVHKPGDEFHRFTYKYNWDNEIEIDKSSKTLANLAMVRLSESVSSIYMNLDGNRHEAPVPLIPRTVHELVSRVKEMCPTVVFHILFQPQWKVNPDADPVLLAEVNNEFFKIAEWGGDKDIISEFLLNIV